MFIKGKESGFKMPRNKERQRGKRIMTEANPERNLHVVLLISGVALVSGGVTGAVGFGLLMGEEHALLGLRTGALLSQTLVWGGLVFVGVGHWVYEAIKDARKPGAHELTLNVDPSQIERPIVSENAVGAEAPAAVKSKRLEEVSV
jgi:hypothetical protein